MQPIELELRGFTAFRETQVVSFEGRGLFAITGPTGAGKSSLLDAMTWALYGVVPRVGRETMQLVSHGAKVMSVRLDFEARGVRYRVSRQAPSSAGTRLEQLRGTSWVPLADRAREVTEQVTALLGLDYATFTKTILLPQGAFDAFLRGDESQRRAILTGLLGLDVYLQVGSTARNRATGASATANTLREQLERLPLASPEALAGLEEEREALTARRATLEQERADLEGLRELGEAASRATADAERATAELRSHEQRAAAAERALSEAERAETEARATLAAVDEQLATLAHDPEAHRALVRRAEAAQRRLAAAAEVERAADAAAASSRAFEALQQRGEELQRAVSERASALAAAEERLSAAGATLRHAITQVAARVEALAEAIAEASGEASEADGRLAALGERARGLGQLRDRLTEARARHEAATQPVGDASALVAESERSAEAAAEAVAAAEAHLSSQRAAFEQAQASHAAVALQRGLKPGDLCPVCGETIESLADIEAPALDAAEAACADAEGELAAAREAHTARVQALAAARERVDAARSALDAAAEGLARSEREALAAGAPTSEAEFASAIDALTLEAREQEQRRQTARERTERAGATERAFTVLLARLPDAGATADESGGTGTTSSATLTDEELDAGAREAASRYEAEAAERERAAREQELAEAETRRHGDELAAAEERARASAAGEAAARERLGALGDLNEDPEALLHALEASERRARRAEQLDGQQRTAAAAAVSATAALEGRRATSDEATASAKRAHELARGAAEAAVLASEAFGAAWQRAVPSDPAPPSAKASEALGRLIAACEQRMQQVERGLGGLEARLAAAHQAATDAARMRIEAERYERTAMLAGGLEQELRKDRFIDFVQREAMQRLARDASSRLEQLSSGRYLLRADQNEFAVIDRLNGDEQRSVKTLSGGETFLASLALALALSEHLPELAGAGGAMSLESLFLDEGFGALDAESLDVAISGLESLAGGQRMVGVISHVPEVAERLSDRIEVVRTGASSVVRAGPRRATSTRAPSADAGSRLAGAAER